jgi:hypothetical protein
MKTAAWAIVALLLWWLVATIGCGGAACVPYILFFYLPFWLPIVGYSAGSEWISQRFAARWSPLSFVGLMVVGGGYLLYILKGRYPLLFVDAEHSMVPVGIIIKPTAAIIALYLIKVIYDRWTLTVRNRQA